jgi:hypothetical protein
VDDQAPFHRNRGSVKPVVNSTESRTPGRYQHREVGNPGTLRSRRQSRGVHRFLFPLEADVRCLTTLSSRPFSSASILFDILGKCRFCNELPRGGMAISAHDY